MGKQIGIGYKSEQLYSAIRSMEATMRLTSTETNGTTTIGHY